MTRSLAMLAGLIVALPGCGNRPPVSPKPTVPSPSFSNSPTTIAGLYGRVWQRGKHYDLISPESPLGHGDEPVKVLEFFWYACPHCYTLEPHLILWNRFTRPKDVRLIPVPVVWRPERLAHARLFYTLQALGREDLDTEVFDEIFHRGNGLAASDDKVAFQKQLEFVKQHGIDPDVFTKAYYSVAVDINMKEAGELAQRYHVQFTPTFIVDGRYTTDPGRTDGNEAELIEVMHDLVLDTKKQRLSKRTVK